MNFDITYDSSADSAPEGFKTTVAAVAQFFESTFTDPVTVNITVKYAPLGDDLGRSEYDLDSYSYAQIRTALSHDSTTGNDALALASLPADDPITVTHTYYMTPAEAKALALIGPSAASDGTATFNSNATFDFDRSDGITPGEYDFYGSVAHEFTEIMGRELNANGNEAQTGPTNGYYPFDLFKYTAPDVRTFVGTVAGYFSPDGGATNLNNFYPHTDGDFGDWAASAGHDSYRAFSDPSVVNAVTSADIAVMDVLGWDAKPSAGDVASSTVALASSGGAAGPLSAHAAVPINHPVTTVPPPHIELPAANPPSLELGTASIAHTMGDWHLV
jgi:hypothetical protein